MKQAPIPSQPRIHVAIGTPDVARSTAFYKVLFGVDPVKVRKGYAKFAVDEPSVNFTLHQRVGSAGGARATDHFGIEVVDRETVAEMRRRLLAAGIEPEVEEGVTCCFAESDKVWAVDPDGNRWETYVVLRDADSYTRTPGPTAAASAMVQKDESPAEERSCCAADCCQ